MIELITGTIKHCTCDLCSYDWETIRVRNPTICPKCRSRQWNGEKALRGRPKNIAITMPEPKKVMEL